MPQPLDREGRTQLLGMFHAASPDWRETVEHVVAEGNTVVIRVTGTGTHESEFMGVPPTGRRVTATGVRIGRIADGRIVES